MSKITEAIHALSPDTDRDTYLYRAVIVDHKNAAQIARELGVSREGVCKHLRRMNARPERRWAMRKPRRRAVA